jgi:Family of unknown function (DUF6011)
MNSPTCQLCGRPLSADESIKNGVGSKCAEKLQSFLVGCGTSIEEIGELALVDDLTTHKWVRLFSMAANAGHKRNALQFIAAARKAAAAVAVPAAA